MNQFFIVLLNNAVISSVLIFAVIMIRACIKKAPRWITCALWGLVAIKLVFPFSIESMLSMIPSSRPIPVDIAYQAVPQIESGVTVINNIVNPVLEANFTPSEVVAVNPMQVVVSLAATVWMVGVAVLCLYLMISYVLLRKKVAVSKNIFENVYLCDDVSNPFILGIMNPGIYLPSGMKQDTMECVLEHEKAHLKRFDHIWKPLGFFILTVYWFHPLCWIAYALLCKDIEFACDEKVTKDRDKAWKATYCQALLDCSAGRRMISACPVAFGEVGVKDRVRYVLNYQKPAFWMIVVAVLSGVVVAVCFMTSPKSESAVTEMNAEAMIGDMQEKPEDTGTIDLVAALTARKWAQAFCDGDGMTIVSMASEEVLMQFEAMEVLGRHGDNVSFSFGSSPMFDWPDEVTPYVIAAQDDINHTADILYYAWTSDPHVTVWREQITLERDGEQYIVSKEKLTCLDNITTAEEFLLAYPFGIRDTLMYYYEGNSMGEALNQNALLSSSYYYKDLFDPATAVYDLLNIGNKGTMPTEVETSGDVDSRGVRISFPDGTIDISMCRPYGENGIWVPYDYHVVGKEETGTMD